MSKPQSHEDRQFLPPLPVLSPSKGPPFFFAFSAFHQDSVVAGLEYVSSDVTYALEVFHGMPVGRVPQDFDGGWAVWGVSLTFSPPAEALAEPLPPADEAIPAP